MKVYLLQHRHELDGDDAEEVKTIGIYSTESNAEAAVQRLVTQPGFRDYPDDFVIDEYEVDQDEWDEGFITQEEWLASIDRRRNDHP